MPIDLTKLTAAPWEVHDGGPNHSICAVTGENTCGPLFERWDGSGDTTDAEFTCLARNAFAGDLEALAWWEANRSK